jgi:hypothetical protein
MGSDNGDVCNVLPSLGIKYFKSFYFIIFLFCKWRTPKLLDGLTTSPKVKTTKGEGVKVCSLARNISKVKGRAGALRWD